MASALVEDSYSFIQHSDSAYLKTVVAFAPKLFKLLDSTNNK